MDYYSNGTTYYSVAMGLCLAAAVMPSNPALKTISKFAGTLIGTMYSSPSDIREAARHTRGMTKTVDNAATSIDTAINTISDDDWEKMARPDVDAAMKKFTAQAKNGSQIYEALARALDQLAQNSFQMSVAGVSVASVLVALSIASVASKTFPPAAPAIELATTASGSAALAALRKIATSSMAIYATAGSIAATVALQMSQSASENMNKAVTPTDSKEMPVFEQVYIPNLPRFGKDHKPLGTKKDA
ncbi:WXG100 family type VII secretion target [Nonomuraea sp. NEAU-A123]|uniref:WXG100 family type VII secretion target n=1 Tax=Nonomuraea sp. NEAU-A123 TaxID=2839649 RepID=UPI001BE3FF18|nr:hypothetical protein [Nonomuraea sp. NEAU-A123]MBT2224516.1 hypothetical protein [Nonomuraea sp. NEAU-A123]